MKKLVIPMGKASIEKALESAKGSLALEDLHLEKQEENLIRQRLTNEISENEFVRKALKLIND